jgi:hypothetical protein
MMDFHWLSVVVMSFISRVILACLRGALPTAAAAAATQRGKLKQGSTKT